MRDHPVQSAVEVDDHEGCYRGLDRDEGCVWGGGGYSLVEEGDAEESSSEGAEEGEGGDGVVGLAIEADESAAAGVEVLRGGDGGGEEGEGVADDFEAGV